MELRNLNFAQICRCCRETGPTMVSIFAESKPNTKYPRMDEMLMAITSLKVSEHDGLPTVLCTSCTDKVQNAYQLRQQLIQSESEFRNCIKHEKNDVENNPHNELMGNILRDILGDQRDDQDDYIDTNDGYEDISDNDVKPTINVNTKKRKQSKGTRGSFECVSCAKEYTTRKSWKRHMSRYHGNNKKWKCTICDKVFGRIEHFKRHLYVHLKEKPFICNKCRRGFNRMEMYNAHVNICKGRRVLSCEVCNKGFVQESTLEVHRKMHDSNDLKHCILTLKDLESFEKFYMEVDGEEDNDKDDFSEKDDNEDDTGDDDSHNAIHISYEHGNKEAYIRKLKCNLCGSIEDTINSREHLSIHLRPKPYCCRKCKRSFERNEYLTSHESICDGKLYLACDMCDEVFQDAKLLEKHCKTHVVAPSTRINNLIITDLEHSTSFYTEIYVNAEESLPVDNLQIEIEEDSDYEQPEDAYIDLSDTEYKPYHVKHVKKKKKSVTPVTPEKRKRGRPKKSTQAAASSPSLFNSDVNQSQNANSNKEFVCPICSLSFKRISLLESHGNEVHENERILHCTQCDQRFSRVYALNRHMQIHKLGAMPYDCTLCDEKFDNREDLINHSKSHNQNDEDTTCYDCCKVFPTLEELQEHMDEEEHFARNVEEAKRKKKRFECEKCTKRFTTQKVLEIHMSKHPEDRNYVCPKCSKSFQSKSNLTEHLRFHDKIKKFLCSECGQSFIRNDYLIIHMRRHRGEKPFKCKFCDKGFPRITDLTVHERYHTGEKTHLCVVCGRGFNRAYNLTVHMRTHTGEKPYKCTYCESAFAQCNDLKAHIRRHTGERFHCDMCSETFLMGYALTQHKRTVHGIKIVSRIGRLEPVDVPNTDAPDLVRMELQEGAVPETSDKAEFNPMSVVAVEQRFS